MEKKIITAREIFQDAKSAFKLDRRFICKTALLSIFLPMVTLSFGLDLSGIATAQGVRDNFFAASPQGKEFASYLGQVFPYFSGFMLISVLIYLIIIAGYCSLAASLCAHFRGVNPENATPDALKKVLPTSLTFLLMLAFTSLVAQIAMFPAIFILCLGTMFPVLQFAEGRSAIKALWHSLTIRYTRSREISKWNVFFNLISIGAFCYTAFILFAFLGEALLNADTFIPIPRSVWYWQVPGTELGLIYAFVSILKSFVLTLVLVSLNLLTNSLYFKTRSQTFLAAA